MNKEQFSLYKIGVAIIDDTHYKLLIRMDEVVESIKNNKPIDQLLQQLKDLQTELLEHLIEEEEFMEEIHYPYIEFHKLSHQHIRKKIKEILDNTIVNRYPSSYTIRDLDKMFSGHIDQDDMQMGEYYKTCQKLH